MKVLLLVLLCILAGCVTSHRVTFFCDTNLKDCLPNYVPQGAQVLSIDSTSARMKNFYIVEYK